MQNLGFSRKERDPGPILEELSPVVGLGGGGGVGTMNIAMML